MPNGNDISVSEALIEAARNRDDLRVSEELTPITFEDGQFVDESPTLE